MRLTSASTVAPVASAKIVSPSDGVCDGTIARAKPSCAISATRSACAFVSRAFVATTPMVVFSRVAAGAPIAAADERKRIFERLAVGRAHAGDGLAGARVDDRSRRVDGDDRADDEPVGQS